jgi:hypothetical protein
MTTMEHKPPIYGILAEFDNADDLVDACKRAREEGYRKMDAYSPIPVEELHEVLHLHDHRVALFTLLGGLFGCFGGFGLQSWCSAIAYPLNIGGRPLISVPMFIPVTFECAILCAGLTAAISMIVLNGLPQPYHPVFNVTRFAAASNNRFFLCIESEDPKFDRHGTARFLESLNPEEVEEVAH